MGRELDAEVAEKVFGWSAKGAEFSRIEEDSLPYYSTDLATAWTVVEHFKSQLFSTRAAFIHALGEEMCLGPQDEMIAGEWWIFSLTPERICRAALKAVGCK